MVGDLGEQVVDAIEQVFNNPDTIDTTRNFYVGTIDNVKIQVNLNRDCTKIVSAFPTF